MAREIGIPPCPAILARFSQEIGKPEPDIRALAHLIGADVALAGALLKLVNSPFYGLRAKASNTHQALSIIGLRSAAQLVTGLILRQAFPASSGPLMQRFWDRVAGHASLAMLLARKLPGMDPDMAHTYALFQDCGIPLMIRKFPGYAGTLDKMEQLPGADLVRDEDMRYRYNHARVGYALARGWLLSETFCQTILRHHEVEKFALGHRDVEAADRRLMAFGMLLEQLARLQAGRGLCPDWPDGEQFVLETLAISPDDVIALAGDANVA